MNQRFFMIYVEGAASPTVKHYSFNAAKAEAERLARHTKKKVYLLEAINSVYQSDMMWEHDVNEDCPF